MPNAFIDELISWRDGLDGTAFFAMVFFNLPMAFYAGL
jgi:hypothetical protein